MRKCCMIIGARCPWRCHLPRSDFQQVTGPSEYVTKHEPEHREPCDKAADGDDGRDMRSEEHTSELQSLMRISYAVFCLKKKTYEKPTNTQHTHVPHTVARQNRKQQ